MKIFVRALMAGCAVCCSVVATAQTIPVMKDLGTLEGANWTEAVAVNDRGEIAGQAYLAGLSGRAFRWTAADGLEDLGTLGGSYSEAMAINAAGQIVGGAYLPDDSYHAFSWTLADGMVDLGTLGGAQTEARAVSDGGHVVGQSERADGTWHAFYWTAADGMVDLGTLGGTNSDALAVNAAGQVVGWAESADGAGHAFSWTAADGMRELPGSTAQAVNAGGLVVGLTERPDGSPTVFSWTQAAGATLAPCTGYSVLAVNDAGLVVFLRIGIATWRSYTWTSLGCVTLGNVAGPGGTYTIARDVNERGQIVGTSAPLDDDLKHPFFWTEAGGMIDLGLGSLMGFAYAVNNLGQVVGGSELVPVIPRTWFEYGPMHAVLWKTDPAAELQSLIAVVEDMDLTTGFTRSLTAKLTQALTELDDATTDDSCYAVASFVSAVSAQKGKHITIAQASALLSPAADVSAMLQCR